MSSRAMSTDLVARAVTCLPASAQMMSRRKEMRRKDGMPTCARRGPSTPLGNECRDFPRIRFGRDDTTFLQREDAWRVARVTASVRLEAPAWSAPS